MIVLVLLSVSIYFTTTLATCPVSIRQTNASSYKALGDDCYYFTTEAVDRFDAESICLNADGYLTSIHSKEENEFVRKHVAETYKVGRRVYIGLERVVGNFYWLDHSSFGDYENFGTKGKDAYTPFAGDMDICTTIDPETGEWWPYRCFFQDPPLPFVCKFKGANKQESTGIAEHSG